MQVPASSHPFYTLFSGAVVALFGLVYAWLAMQPRIVRPLLLVGACGKLSAVVISVALFATGQLSGLLTLFVSGDLLFVVLWFYFLRQELGAVDFYP